MLTHIGKNHLGSRLGFAYGAGLYLSGTYWIYTAVHVFGKAPVWLALFLMLGLVAIMASYYAIVGWLAARWLPRGSARRWLVALPALWVLMEWARGWLFSGFPWLEIGYAHSDSPLAGYAPLGGVHLVTLAGALTAGAAVAAIRGRQRDRVLAVLVAALAWTAGAALRERPWTTPSGGEIPVAIVQGAVPQDLKWQDANRDATLRLYREMTGTVLGTPLITIRLTAFSRNGLAGAAWQQEGAAAPGAGSAGDGAGIRSSVRGSSRSMADPCSRGATWWTPPPPWHRARRCGTWSSRGGRCGR